MFQVTEVLLTNAKHWVMYQVTKMVGWCVGSIGIGIAFRLIGANDSCSDVCLGKVQAGGLA